MYIIRLDDASCFMDVEKWNKIEQFLDTYSIKPIVGVIPNNEDRKFTNNYDYNPEFWKKVNIWVEKEWRIALHGFNHVYLTKSGGINPVNKKSEFAGLPLEVQQEKIRNGYKILCDRGLKPDIFYAPSHTFDLNTLKALEVETDIHIISDTIADDIYYEYGFYFIPQQTGSLRRLPFKVTTICLHPNTMNDEQMENFNVFIKKNFSKIINAFDCELKKRPLSFFDRLLRTLYFLKGKLIG